MTSAPETWHPVVGFEGRYDVSDAGRVRSYQRPGYGKDLNTTPTIMTPTVSSCGYRRVKLWRDGRAITVRVHVLVAAAFLGPRPEGLVVAHRDGLAAGDGISNVVYATQAENIAHKVAHGTSARGEGNPQSKMTEERVRETRALLRSGVRPLAIAGRFGVSRDTIEAIERGQRWAHVV